MHIWPTTVLRKFNLSSSVRLLSYALKVRARNAITRIVSFSLSVELRCDQKGSRRPLRG